MLEQEASNKGAQVDDVEGMEGRFVQIQGKARGAVEAAGRALGLEGTYIPKSYIEQVQLAKLTASFQSISEDLRRRFVVDGEPLLESDSIGSSPVLASSLRRTTGFAVPPLASSGARPRPRGVCRAACARGRARVRAPRSADGSQAARRRLGGQQRRPAEPPDARRGQRQRALRRPAQRGRQRRALARRARRPGRLGGAPGAGRDPGACQHRRLGGPPAARRGQGARPVRPAPAAWCRFLGKIKPNRAAAAAQADGLAAHLAAMDERLKTLASRPPSPAPDLGPQLQALAAAQDALGGHMHALGEAVRALDARSAARDRAGVAAAAAACALAGAAAALAVVCLLGRGR